MIKLLKWAVLAIVLLIVIGLAAFWFTLDHLVRSTVQSQATASLNTQTTLGGASVSPFRGQLSLADLKIANPPGYTAPDILSLNDASLAVSYSQLRQDPVRVDSLTLKHPTLTLEQKDLKTNLQALMDRLPKTESAPPDQKPLRLVISDLTVDNPTVVLRPGLPGLSQDITLNLPSLNLKNVGTGPDNQNGAAIKDVVMLVLTDIASKAADSDQLPPELRQLLHLNVNQLADQLKSQLNIQLEKLGTDLTQKLNPNLAPTVTNLLKNPSAATTNPTQTLEQGLGSFLNKTPHPAKKK